MTTTTQPSDSDLTDDATWLGILAERLKLEAHANNERRESRRVSEAALTEIRRLEQLLRYKNLTQRDYDPRMAVEKAKLEESYVRYIAATRDLGTIQAETAELRQRRFRVRLAQIDPEDARRYIEATNVISSA